MCCSPSYPVTLEGLNSIPALPESDTLGDAEMIKTWLLPGAQSPLIVKGERFPSTEFVEF